ncbi:hypothetical protein Btru_013476 [Bulinus truncatus]|nr:hypothetical protein Btru_013476 [Bulinus truncatus]
MVTRHTDMVPRNIDMVTCHTDMVTRHIDVVTHHIDMVIRHIDMVTRHRDMVTRHTDMVTRNIDMVTRHTDMVTRHIDMVTRHIDLVTRNIDMVTRHTDMVTCHIDIVTRHIDMVTRHIDMISSKFMWWPASGHTVIDPQPSQQIVLLLLLSLLIDYKFSRNSRDDGNSSKFTASQTCSYDNEDAQVILQWKHEKKNVLRLQNILWSQEGQHATSARQEYSRTNAVITGVSSVKFILSSALFPPSSFNSLYGRQDELSPPDNFRAKQTEKSGEFFPLLFASRREKALGANK